MPSLFERLPTGLFSPLAAPNRQRYWDLLLRLFNEFFGPDAPAPEGDGYLKRPIILSIEEFIRETPDWTQTQEEEDPSLTARAHATYRALECAGWIKEERIGVKHFCTMPSTVQKFLEILRQFADEGPQIVGGKVQVIHNQLEQVLVDPVRQAAGFHETAIQARQLIALLSATTMRVRDAISLLSSQESTAAFVRTFFDDYVSQIYIRDYHELTTRNHPLRHRWRIVEIAYELRDTPEKRKALIDHYRVAFRCATLEEAEGRFEKDLGRFLKFQEIDTYLKRLHDSVHDATAAALSYLNYRLRTQDRLDRLLSTAFDHILDSEEDDMRNPILLSGPLLSEKRLVIQSKNAGPPVRVAIRRPAMTIEQRAQIELRRIINANREVNPAKLGKYLDVALGPASELDAGQLTINDIQQLCLFFYASRISLVTAHATTEHRKRNIPVIQGFSFEVVPGEFTDNDYLTVPRFLVKRTQHRRVPHA